jgi:hypothetical protein
MTWSFWRRTLLAEGLARVGNETLFSTAVALYPFFWPCIVFVLVLVSSSCYPHATRENYDMRNQDTEWHMHPGLFSVSFSFSLPSLHLFALFTLITQSTLAGAIALSFLGLPPLLFSPSGLCLVDSSASVYKFATHAPSTSPVQYIDRPTYLPMYLHNILRLRTCP